MILSKRGIGYRFNNSHFSICYIYNIIFFSKTSNIISSTFSFFMFALFSAIDFDNFSKSTVSLPQFVFTSIASNILP